MTYIQKRHKAKSADRAKLRNQCLQSGCRRPEARFLVQSDETTFFSTPTKPLPLKKEG